MKVKRIYKEMRKKYLLKSFAAVRLCIISCIVFTLLLLNMTINLSAKELKNVGVLKFRGKGVPAIEAEGISDLFCVGLVNSDSFKVLDRANMNNILEEQAFQMTGCTDEDCAVEIGQLLNMDFMFTGAVLKIATKIYITVNMISVETGEIIKSSKTKGFLYENLDAQIDHLVSYFAGPNQTVKSFGQQQFSNPNSTPTVTEKDLGIVHYSNAPGIWTVDIPRDFIKIEVAVYSPGKNDVNKYGGWNGKLDINNKPAWSFVRYDNTQGGIIMDYIIKKEIFEKSGKGQYLDVTSLVNAGKNTFSYYHYTSGAGIGVKLKITSGK